MDLKLVTFNIRIQSPREFAKRLPAICDKLREKQPDIICFQELSTDMQKMISNAFPEYTFVGGGRNCDRLGEGTPIVFKKERFVLNEFRTRWLSDTPMIPESSFGGDQSGCPRVYTFSLLSDRESGISLRVYNTHFDHEGKNARYKEAEMLLAEIDSDNKIYPYDAVITGDLNAMPGTKEIKLISESDSFTDVTDHFEQTFNNYGEPFNYDEFMKIDYIFISNGITCTDTEIWNETPDGMYLSDHFPIMAYLHI